MKEIAQLVGAAGAYAVMACLVFMVFVSLAMPFMLISVVRNIARMRRALERIADGGENSGRATPGSILRT